MDIQHATKGSLLLATEADGKAIVYDPDASNRPVASDRFTKPDGPCGPAGCPASFCSGTADAIASRRCAPGGSPLPSTAMPQSAQDLLMATTKVNRPESQSLRALVSNPRRRTGAANRLFKVAAEGRSWSVRQRPPRTMNRASGSSFPPGRRSSCHAGATRMADPSGPTSCRIRRAGPPPVFADGWGPASRPPLRCRRCC